MLNPPKWVCATIAPVHLRLKVEIAPREIQAGRDSAAHDRGVDGAGQAVIQCLFATRRPSWKLSTLMRARTGPKISCWASTASVQCPQRLWAQGSSHLQGFRGRDHLPIRLLQLACPLSRPVLNLRALSFYHRARLWLAVGSPTVNWATRSRCAPVNTS